MPIPPPDRLVVRRFEGGAALKTEIPTTHSPPALGAAYVASEGWWWRVYGDDELATLTTELLHQQVHDPASIDEAWLAAVRRLVGEDQWRIAETAFEAMTERTRA